MSTAPFKLSNYKLPTTNSRQVRLHSLILYKLAQPFFDRWTRIKVAKNINLPLQLLIWDRFHKLLRRRCRPPVKFPDLAGRRARYPQRLAFGGNLAHQPDLLRLHYIEAAPGEQQIAHHRIAQIPLQARNPAESRNQPKPQFREAKSRHAVRNTNGANQGQFEPAAKRDA